MSSLPPIDSAEEYYAYLEALFRGVQFPYMVVTGSSRGNNHEKSLMNLFYGVNKLLLSGYEPIGGVSASGLPDYPSFYQAIYNKDGFSAADEEKIRLRQELVDQQIKNGVQYRTILENLK